MPAGAAEGGNDFGGIGWGGPCPPAGEHRYAFRLYALDVPKLGRRLAHEAAARGGDGGPRSRRGAPRGNVPPRGAVATAGVQRWVATEATSIRCPVSASGTSLDARAPRTFLQRCGTSVPPVSAARAKGLRDWRARMRCGDSRGRAAGAAAGPSSPARNGTSARPSFVHQAEALADSVRIHRLFIRADDPLRSSASSPRSRASRTRPGDSPGTTRAPCGSSAACRAARPSRRAG